MRPTIILIGNYPPDGQESMRRFADMLLRGLQDRGLDARLLTPQPRLCRSSSSTRGMAKWLGYIDKFLLFPRELKRLLAAAGPGAIFHVCDHSNAHYCKYLQGVPHLVTCHDLLAIRSARGEIPQHPTRASGRILQRIIESGIRSARNIAAVSEATREDLLRLFSLPSGSVAIVPNGLNYPYTPMPAPEAAQVLAKLGVEHPYLLHVGGNQWYKNRLGVLRIHEEMTRRQPQTPRLVLAGTPLTDEMRGFIAQHGLQERVLTLTSVSNEELRALYSAAELLLFPSLAEGFGWPVVEAQACGCRVVTSNRAPLTEVAGDSAAFIDPEDIPAAADAVLQMLAEDSASRIEEGFRNMRRFSADAMITNYIALYEKLG